MNNDPWTVGDPRRGDSDAELATINDTAVEYHDGDPMATLRTLISVEGDDARLLERLVEAGGTSVHDVVAGLLRAADRPVV